MKKQKQEEKNLEEELREREETKIDVDRIVIDIDTYLVLKARENEDNKFLKNSREYQE